VLAAGCGDDDDDGEAAVLATSSTLAPVPATCPLGDDEASFAIGAPAAGAFQRTDRSATCRWSFDGGEVTLNIERGAGADAHEQYEQIAGAEAVDGLGDSATWVPAQRVLSVLDGVDVYMVLVTGLDDPLPVAREVVRLALAGS